MRISVLLVFFLIILGLTGYAYSQNIITTTTTRIVTIQPTTIVTEVTVSGTTGTVTLQIPGFLLIMETREPGRQCTVIFTAQQPPSILVFPGTTITGTTFSTVITQQPSRPRLLWSKAAQQRPQPELKLYKSLRRALQYQCPYTEWGERSAKERR